MSDSKEPLTFTIIVTVLLAVTLFVNLMTCGIRSDAAGICARSCHPQASIACDSGWAVCATPDSMAVAKPAK